MVAKKRVKPSDAKKAMDAHTRSERRKAARPQPPAGPKGPPPSDTDIPYPDADSTPDDKGLFA